MSTLQLTILAAAALAVSVSVGYAGPCRLDIERMQARIDATLAAKAAVGPSAREGTEALLHRQPTPGSIAAAEVRLGDQSARSIEVVKLALARARAADGAGDKPACEQALADAQRAIDP